MPNLFVFKNHYLHHYFQKSTKSRFFQTHEHMSQTRGICLCLIHFQKRNHHYHLFKKNQIIKILRFPKNHAFIFKLEAFGSQVSVDSIRANQDKFKLVLQDLIR